MDISIIVRRFNQTHDFMIPENWREDILKDLNKYRSVSPLAEATIGNKIVNDASVFARIRDRRDITVGNYLKIKNWFAVNMPKQPTRSNRKPEGSKEIRT